MVRMHAVFRMVMMVSCSPWLGSWSAKRGSLSNLLQRELRTDLHSSTLLGISFTLSSVCASLSGLSLSRLCPLNITFLLAYTPFFSLIPQTPSQLISLPKCSPC